MTEALQKMKGKIPEIAGSHVSSRVLQVFFLISFVVLSMFNFTTIYSSLQVDLFLFMNRLVLNTVH